MDTGKTSHGRKLTHTLRTWHLCYGKAFEHRVILEAQANHYGKLD